LNWVRRDSRLLIAIVCLILILPAAVPAQKVSRIDLAPTSLAGGTTSTATVTLSSKGGTGGITVTLNSSSIVATVPASITIASGVGKASFSVNTTPVSVLTTSTITASLGATTAKAVLTITPPKVVSISFSPSKVTGGASSTGTIKISSPAPFSGISVPLSSNSPAWGGPSAASFSANSISASFVCHPIPVSTIKTATVTAKFGGSSSSSTLTVLAPTLNDLTVSPSILQGGSNTTGTVSLTGEAPPGGVKVSLTGNQTTITVPKSVTVPSAATSTKFIVATAKVSKQSIAKVTATVGSTSIGTPLTLNPSPLVGLSLSPATVFGGAVSTGTVRLDSNAPVGGFAVFLSSNSPVATVTPSLIVPAGSRSATFSITTTSVSTQTIATITARDSTGFIETAQLTISVRLSLADTPWPKYHGSLLNCGVGLGDGASGIKKWSVQMEGSFVTSSPAIGKDGTVYVGAGDGRLYSIKPDGSTKWAFQTGSTIEYSSPAIAADGTVYIGCDDSRLYAIKGDGSKKWAFATGGVIQSSPTIAPDGTIYFGSYDNFLYALNSDGSKKWSFQTAGRIFSSPAIGSDGTIYIGSQDTNLYAINPDGSKKWAFQTGSVIFPSPAIGPDGTIYIGSNDLTLHAVNPDGTLKWAYYAPYNFGIARGGGPAVSADGTIYAVYDYYGPSGTYLFALNSNGSRKWSYQLSNVLATGLESAPAIGSNGTVYIGSFDGRLYAINSNGSLKWSFGTGAMIESSPAIGQDGSIYFGSDDYNLYAIK